MKMNTELSLSNRPCVKTKKKKLSNIKNKLKKSKELGVTPESCLCRKKKLKENTDCNNRRESKSEMMEVPEVIERSSESNSQNPSKSIKKKAKNNNKKRLKETNFQIDVKPNTELRSLSKRLCVKPKKKKLSNVNKLKKSDEADCLASESDLCREKKLKENTDHNNIRESENEMAAVAVPEVMEKSSESNSQNPSESMKKKSKKNKKIKLKETHFLIDVNPCEEELKIPSFKAEKRKVNFKKRDVDIHIKERNLTTLLFSDCGPLEDFSKSDPLFLDDNVTGFGEDSDIEKEETDDEVNLQEDFGTAKRKEAWSDDDDTIKVKDIFTQMSRGRGTRPVREASDAKYKDMVEEKFAEVYGSAPEWAQLDREVADDDQEREDDEEIDMKMKTTSYLASSKLLVNLPKKDLHFLSVNFLNEDSRREGNFIKSIEFDSEMSLALVAGCSGTFYGAVTLFKFDGKRNLKIKSVMFPKYPVSCARFIPKRHQFVVGSNVFKRFYVCDIKSGKKSEIPWPNKRPPMKTFEITPDGQFIAFVCGHEVLFFDCQTVSLFETLTVPCEVNAIAFHPEAPTVYVYGNNGQVYLFDIGTWRCFHAFFDDGCVHGSVIAVSPNGRLLACGSSSGIVNVYDASSLGTSQTPAPVKVFARLVTEITSLTFSPTSEILAMASSYKENAVRLVHTGSLTVFDNFPGSHTFKVIQSIRFSPDHKYIALGNNTKSAYLCKLLHY